MLRVRVYVIGNVETDAKRGVPTNHVIFIVILSHILISDARSASLHFYILMSYIELNQNRYPTDNDGYLKQLEDWSESLAEKIAEKEQIQLTEEHWEIIWLVRDFYQEYKTSPAIRMLVKAMAQKFGEEKGNSRYLQRLFPEGPAKQATKIAIITPPRNDISRLVVKT